MSRKGGPIFHARLWFSFRPDVSRNAARRAHRPHLCVESLENRVTLSSGAITTLASFPGGDGRIVPFGVIRDGEGNLYGTTQSGGTFDYGTVFEYVKASATLKTLISFDQINGETPEANLIMDNSGNLYGTTSLGGAFDEGTVFEILKSGGAFATLGSFDGNNGGSPDWGLTIDASGNLYGTTADVESTGRSTVFELPHGSDTITTLASIAPDDGSAYGLPMDAAGNLYGVTIGGGRFTEWHRV